MHANSKNKIHVTTVSVLIYICNDNSESDTFLHLQSVCSVYLLPKNLIWVLGGEFIRLKSSALQLNPS